MVEYKPLLDKALAHAKHKVQNCIILQREGLPPAQLHPSLDSDWAGLVHSSTPFDGCVPVDSSV